MGFRQKLRFLVGVSGWGASATGLAGDRRLGGCGGCGADSLIRSDGRRSTTHPPEDRCKKATLPDTSCKRGNPPMRAFAIVAGPNNSEVCGVHRSRVGIFSETSAWYGCKNTIQYPKGLLGTGSLA